MLQNKLILYLISFITFIFSSTGIYLYSHHKGYVQGTLDCHNRQIAADNKELMKQRSELNVKRATIESMAFEIERVRSKHEIQYKTITKEVIHYVKESPAVNVDIPLGWVCLLSRAFNNEYSGDDLGTSGFCNDTVPIFGDN